MASVVCCCTLEVKYKKKGGGCKVVNDTAIQVSDIDQYLNGIMRKSNYHSFISVKMISIHERPLQSAYSEDDSDSGEETEDAGETLPDETPPPQAAGGVEQ